MDEIARNLPALAWERLSAGEGSKGERLYDWTMIAGWQQDGWTHGLLVRRSIEQEPEHAYYGFHARAAKATLGALVRVAGQRWQIEQAFQAAKGECGLDHYEVRSWHGWYRHITLAMLAFAALVTLRSRGEKKLPSGRFRSAYRSYATCSHTCSGADGTALSISCTGQAGAENINSTRSDTTTKSAD